MKRPQLTKQFNWRAALMRVVINAAVLALTALILPKIYFADVTVSSILFISIVLGVLNAFVKPIIQFLTLSFIFTTYGLVVVLINAIILLLLSWLFNDRFVVDGFLAAMVGGALIGILGSFFESFLGLSLPIIPDKADELRKRPQVQAPLVTQIILNTDQEEESVLADPAAPLPVNHQDTVSKGVEGSDFNRAEEKEVEEGKREMEVDTMPIDEDLENADTLGQTVEQASETGDDDPNGTAAQTQENESWR